MTENFSIIPDIRHDDMTKDLCLICHHDVEVEKLTCQRTPYSDEGTLDYMFVCDDCQAEMDAMGNTFYADMHMLSRFQYHNLFVKRICEIVDALENGENHEELRFNGYFFIISHPGNDHYHNAVKGITLPEFLHSMIFDWDNGVSHKTKFGKYIITCAGAIPNRMKEVI